MITILKRLTIFYLSIITLQCITKNKRLDMFLSI